MRLRQGDEGQGCYLIRTLFRTVQETSMILVCVSKFVSGFLTQLQYGEDKAWL